MRETYLDNCVLYFDCFVDKVSIHKQDLQLDEQHFFQEWEWYAFLVTDVSHNSQTLTGSNSRIPEVSSSCSIS